MGNWLNALLLVSMRNAPVRFRQALQKEEPVPLFFLTTDQRGHLLVLAEDLDAAEALADRYCTRTSQKIYGLVQMPDSQACALIASANTNGITSQPVLLLTPTGLARLRPSR